MKKWKGCIKDAFSDECLSRSVAGGSEKSSKVLKESGSKSIGEGLKIMSDLTQDGIQNASED